MFKDIFMFIYSCNGVSNLYEYKLVSIVIGLTSLCSEKMQQERNADCL